MIENAKTKAVWTAGSGPQRVTHWGEHPWSWWRKQVAGYRGDAPPRLLIRVRAWDGNGAPASGQDFAADDLRGAKAFAKSWTEQSTGSATVAGRVYLHGEGDFTAEDFGEYAFDAPKQFYIWQVDHDYMPINRRGPFSDQDEARREGRRIAQSAIYHQVTTLGDDPSHPGFALDRVFRSGSGEVFTMSMAERAAERLGEYRGNPEFRSGRMRVDLRDAIDHMQQSEDDELSEGDFEISEPVMLSVGDLDQYDDLSSWVELGEGELLEDQSALGSFRGSSWKRLAQGWTRPEDMPPIVIMETPTQTAIADGRGRTNYAIGMGWQFIPAVFAVHRRVASERHPNSSGYYVWLLDRSSRPLTTEGPYGPYHTLEGAKPFARISATKGTHDRAISRGRDPRGEDFEIVRRYQARSGARII